MPSDQEIEGFSEEEEEWISEQRERSKQKGAISDRGGDSDGDVNINSLMDILVVLLVFLLKSYGDQPIQVVGKDLRVPKSTAKLQPEDMTAITISRKHIVVDDDEILKLKDGTVDEKLKKGGENNMIIQPLLKKINKVMEKKKEQSKLFDEKFDPMATIVADRTTSYRLLTEVMFTASNAELSKFKFAVIKSPRADLM